MAPEEIETGPFSVIEPHKKFNTTWCELFSWELEDHTEQDLLDVCPEENETSYNSIEEYRTHPFKQQPRPKRNKRQLDSTTPPSLDGTSKKNKQDDDDNSTFSESHSVSELRVFFEDQCGDPPQVNVERSICDPDVDKLNEGAEESGEHLESDRHPNEDIYLTELPENTLYITHEIRTQGVTVPDVQKDQNVEDQQIENQMSTFTE